MRWTAVPIALKPQLKVDGDKPVSAPLLNGTGNQDGGWSTEFLLYSLSPAMLTNRARWRIRYHSQTPARNTISPAVSHRSFSPPFILAV